MLTPIMSNAVEISAKTSDTIRLLKAFEMRNLGQIIRNSVLDQRRNEAIRHVCEFKDVVKWPWIKRSDH